MNYLFFVYDIVLCLYVIKIFFISALTNFQMKTLKGIIEKMA
jgi:hypothetical protein